MSKELKIAAKHLVVFSLLLATLHSVDYWLLVHLSTGKNMGDVMTYQAWFMLLDDALNVAFAFWLLIKLKKNIRSIRYWKMATSSVLLFAFSYHFYFLFRTIYFSITHPDYVGPETTGKSEFDMLMELFSQYNLNSVPPNYTPFNYLFGYFKEVNDMIVYGGIRFGRIIFGFFTNPTVLSFWSSLIVWMIYNGRKISESTLDNE